MTGSRADAGAAITLRNLSLGYDGNPVVDNVSGEIGKGALLALVGPNGAGKSTLLKALAGLLRPLSGTIAGLPVGNRIIAYMPQQNELDRSFPISVLDFVAMGLWREIGWWRPISISQRERARSALMRVGLAGLEDRRIGALSGGQIRRTLFARAWLQDAPVVLLDEPFAGIDTATAGDLLEIIRNWHVEGRTIVAALHDLDQVRAYFFETLLLAKRVVAWGPSTEVLTEDHLANARAWCAPDADPVSRVAVDV